MKAQLEDLSRKGLVRDRPQLRELLRPGELEGDAKVLEQLVKLELRLVDRFWLGRDRVAVHHDALDDREDGKVELVRELEVG